MSAIKWKAINTLLKALERYAILTARFFTGWCHVDGCSRTRVEMRRNDESCHRTRNASNRSADY